jgi:hypothetical protein
VKNMYVCFYFCNSFVIYIYSRKIYSYIPKELQNILLLYKFWRTKKKLIYEFLKNSTNLVPKELTNLIYEFLKNSTNLVPGELINLIWIPEELNKSGTNKFNFEFPKNSTNGLVPEELRKILISDEFNIPTSLKDGKLIVIYYKNSMDINWILIHNLRSRSTIINFLKYESWRFIARSGSIVVKYLKYESLDS